MTTHELIERLNDDAEMLVYYADEEPDKLTYEHLREFSKRSIEAAQAISTLTAEVEELREAFDKRPALPLVYDTVQLKDFNRRYCAWENSMRATLTKAEGTER